jgi:PAS domain S-box-containing protein
MPNIRTAMNRGAYDFLTKPLNFADLGATLSRAIQHVTTIRTTDQQYRLLAERAADGMAVVQEEKVVFVNEALCRIFRDTADHLLQKPPRALLPNGEIDHARGDPEHVVHDSPAPEWQIHQITREGQECWLETHQSAIQWAGKPAILVTVRDITMHTRHARLIEQEEARLLEENLSLKELLADLYGFGDLVGHSQAMQQVYSQILRTATADGPVLIAGESGTGKELVAKTIHRLSRRSRHTFVPVNCGAIPEALFESELFGYRKGAFTGAETDKSGFFGVAHQGTIFLDEVSELTPAMQVKLLRTIETGEYTPVGSTAAHKTDVRIIAATNRNLIDLVEAKAFRDDLFYRLHVFEILVPPLRERKEDLPLLIERFLERFAQQESQRVLPQDVLDRLLAYQWPGNVRELQNVLCRYVTTHLLSFASRRDVVESCERPEIETFERGINGTSLNAAMQDFEKHLIIQALRHNNWHRANTAGALGVTVRNLRRKIAKYQILQSYKRIPSTTQHDKSGQK